MNMFPSSSIKSLLVPGNDRVNALRSLSTISRSNLLFGNSIQYKNAVASLVYRNPHYRGIQVFQVQRPNRGANAWRTLSSDASGNHKKENGDKKDEGGNTEDGIDEKQMVLTPGQKVVAYSRLGMWAGIFGFACACAYYIGRELFPSKMSPNSVFDGALEVVRNNSEVRRRFGEPIKGYGRDHGGHREGRRNFIEHTTRVDEEDGSKRTRVRFNIEGPYGHAFVFAEVSSDMPSGEFVYVLVQDKANGRVQTIIDNRAALTAARLAGGNKESMAAMSQLLGGGKRSG